MVPSYMTMPVHVTTKEMVACFTFPVILLCSDLRTFYLIYLYLGILTTSWHLGFLCCGLLQWCWWFQQLVALVALLSGWPLLNGSNVFRLWWFQHLATVVSNGGPWFAISMSLALICLSALGMLFSKATVFPLPWQFWRLVTRVGVMKEFVLPSCPVLTTSRGFTVGPGWLSGIAFIVNAGDVGLSCFL